MRFTSILFAALPLIGSVLAAPLAKSEVAAVDVTKRSLDVLSVVAELEANVHAAGSLTSQSSDLEVHACLSIVVDAFDRCGHALGIDLSLGVGARVSIAEGDSGVIPYDQREQVAQVIANVVAVVQVNIVQQISSTVRQSSPCHDLLSKIDCSLQSILCGLDSLLGGILHLVKGILGNIGCVLDGVLGGVLSIL
ncbi:hypothetical protein L204_103038 [Cryptococcus depauperatus]|nr:hypothetical protein L204_00215 [Cryptococcus depauperatus CBS 7855]